MQWIDPVVLVALAILGGVLIAYKLWDPTGWKAFKVGYPHRGQFPVPRIRARRAQVDDSVQKHGLWLGADARGLHVASLDWQHMLLVPWSQVAVTWGQEPDIDDLPDDPALHLAVRLEFRDAGETLVIPKDTASELAAAAGEHWPAPRMEF
ncbi:MAG: hypothetical protein FJZ01_18680 [Candidatus Sericytochromatia bacterium]|nr:hypothetical protein [Candidatus Tanganyikabacteria bacterium]